MVPRRRRQTARLAAPRPPTCLFVPCPSPRATSPSRARSHPSPRARRPCPSPRARRLSPSRAGRLVPVASCRSPRARPPRAHGHHSTPAPGLVRGFLASRRPPRAPTIRPRRPRTRPTSASRRSPRDRPRCPTMRAVFSFLSSRARTGRRTSMTSDTCAGRSRPGLLGPSPPCHRSIGA